MPLPLMTIAIVKPKAQYEAGRKQREGGAGSKQIYCSSQAYSQSGYLKRSLFESF